MRRPQGPRLLRQELKRPAAFLLTILLASACAPGRSRPAPAPAPPLPSTPAYTVSLIKTWMDARPAIARSLVWEDAGGDAVPFEEWRSSRRTQLVKMTRLILEGGSPDLPQAPPLLTVPDPNGGAQSTDFAPGPAWRTYVAYAAQSLATEIGRRVPWSIEKAPPEILALLFDSRSLFRWKDGGYAIPPALGAVTPGDPAREAAFLRGNGLVGATPRETIEKIVAWCRDNVVHFVGTAEAKNFYAHWRYYGFPPVERVLGGTVFLDDPAMGTRHWTFGCWGTAGLLRSLLRTVNVPADLLDVCDHALPRFPGERLYLSHGDDPYNRLSVSGRFSPSDLLIDEATFARWFDPSAPGEELCDRVGLRVKELAYASPPDYLLKVACDDREAQRPHAESHVFKTLEPVRSLEQLESERLWDRLDEAIRARGGCAAIPRETL